MAKRFLLLAVVLIVLIAVSGFLFKDLFQRTKYLPNIQRSQVPTSTPTQIADIPRLSVVAVQLEVPWALTFLPDKSMLVAERPGRVRMIDPEGNLVVKPLLTLPVVQKIQGEGGLLGITLHPDFEKNKYVYLYYTYATQGNNSINRVSRYTLNNNALIDEKIIVDKIPGALFHNGGRIKFGPDKNLYITTGDSQNPSLAQDKNALAGKILRVTDTGAPASGNPFGTAMYSYGHRNPQGITWDNQGKLWETEHGQTSTDELNMIESGKNYGWPTIRGDERQNGFVTPIANSGSTTWAPGDIVYVSGSLFWGGLRGESLYQGIISGNSVTIKTHLQKELGRIREVIAGPDGMLYITTSNRDGRGIPSADDDRIIRVNPAKL